MSYASNKEPVPEETVGVSGGKREHLRENLNKTVEFDHRVSFIV